MLTIIIPTRNRPNHCAAIIRFLTNQGTPHRIVVADSSDPAEAELLRTACPRETVIHSFPTEIGPADKYMAAIDLVDTPFAVLVPDDDITFPHALDRCLAYLIAHPDSMAAHGYILDFGIQDHTFDLVRVRWFTPTIGEDDPLQRLYHLTQRYQPFFWAVFRTDAFRTALRHARIPEIILFQEMTFMATSVLLGKVARLPCVYSLRGMEESLSLPSQTHPFFALLDDSEAFFEHYAVYRNALAAFIESEIRPTSCEPSQLKHALNLMHAVAFAPAFDRGMTNYTLQRLLGEPHPPVTLARQWTGVLPIEKEDFVGQSDHTGRRYVWRRSVLKAEPLDEITITSDERDTVNKSLDHYKL